MIVSLHTFNNKWLFNHLKKEYNFIWTYNNFSTIFWFILYSKKNPYKNIIQRFYHIKLSAIVIITRIKHVNPIFFQFEPHKTSEKMKKKKSR